MNQQIVTTGEISERPFGMDRPEMTGLNPEQDRIIEMATIITDGDLNVIAEGPVLAIRQEQAFSMA